jgi:hypothetical protein
MFSVFLIVCIISSTSTSVFQRCEIAYTKTDYPFMYYQLFKKYMLNTLFTGWYSFRTSGDLSYICCLHRFSTQMSQCLKIFERHQILSRNTKRCKEKFIINSDVSSLKQQSSGVQVNPLGHILLIPSQPVFVFTVRLHKC